MWFLSLLPVGLVAFMAVTQPGYMVPFITDPRGRIMLVSAATMVIVGVVVMRRLGSVKA